MNKPRPFTENNLKQLFAESGDEFILLETARTTPEDNHSYLFTGATEQLCHYAGDDPVIFLQKCETFLDRGYYLAGWLSYEFGYELENTLKGQMPCKKGALLAELGLYSSRQIFDHTKELHIQTSMDTPPAPCQIDNISLSQSKTQYLEHIKTIQKYIRAGDTYQVNYTLKLLFDFLGVADDLYLKLRRNQQVSFGAYIKQKNRSIMSFSPELFFKKEGQTITVRPMKGTIARGRTRAEDEQNSQFLKTDLKSLAENVMIVDLLRNDLGRIADIGMVSPTSLFDVEVYNSLLQMTSTITAQTPKDLNLVKLFKALFPCGSVTGAPKIRTMEIIRELEDGPRNIYTGAIGFLGPNGQASFNVPIRTVILDGDKGQMGIGSGIVADSNPEQEWQECLLKGEFLTKAHKPFELIETILWQPESGFKFAKQHGERMQESARYFNFIFSAEDYNRALKQIGANLQTTTSRVRLALSQEGQITTTITPCLPPAPFLPVPTVQEHPAKVCFSGQSTSSQDPFLYHKTTNRALYNETWRKATKSGYLDAIFTNEKQEISEGCISNIFLLKNNQLLTPPVTAGLLPGVFRQHLFAQYPDQIKEQTLYKKDILDGDAIICIGNSVRGLIPVEIDEDELI